MSDKEQGEPTLVPGHEKQWTQCRKHSMSHMIHRYQLLQVCKLVQFLQ